MTADRPGLRRSALRAALLASFASKPGPGRWRANDIAPEYAVGRYREDPPGGGKASALLVRAWAHG